MSELFHEIEIIKNFVRKDRMDRYLKLLTVRSGRSKFVQSLSHFSDFDKKFIQPIKSDLQYKSFISEYLINNGNTEVCFVISELKVLDEKKIKIADAINDILGFGMGTIVSVVPGKLAYYEGEDDRFFLKK